MLIKNLKVIGNRNYINGQPLAHLVWNHYHADDPWTPGHAIHHKDEDTLNDWHENLHKLIIGDHTRIHHLGKIVSIETRIKSSDSHKGKPSSFKGKYHRKESKLKNRMSHLGKKFNDETKKKMSLSAKGKPKTDIHKENISKGSIGKKLSDEHKKRISEAKKQYYAKKKLGVL
jgi:hypothetical protein